VLLANVGTERMLVLFATLTIVTDPNAASIIASARDDAGYHALWQADPQGVLGTARMDRLGR
jgi:hypothetical protein